MPTGATTSYDLAVGIKVLIDEAIYMNSPDDLPLLTGLGSDGLTVLSTAPASQTKFEWQEEERLTPRSALAANTAGAATNLELTAGDTAKFGVNDLVVIRPAAGGVAVADEEVMLVTAIVDADNLTVTRAIDSTGSSANAYVTGDIVIGIGKYAAEGGDPGDFRSIDRTRPYNVTQIFGPEKIQMSRTHTRVVRYGVPNEWAHQLANRMLENGIQVEQALLYGKRIENSSNKTRATGGLSEWITVVDGASTSLTVAALETRMQVAYNAGGVPDRLIANPSSLGDLNALADTGRVRQTFEDPRRGRIRTMGVYTEFGEITICRNRWCNPLDAFAFRREQATRRIIDPLVFERLAKTGDSEVGQIVREEGLQFKGAAHAFRFTNLTTYTPA